MIKQDNGCPHRERLETRSGIMLRRALAGILSEIGVIIMGASLVLPSSAYAHNIDLLKAREVIRTYARAIRDQSGGKYLRYQTSCVNAFPGHNHIVRCVVEYQNAADLAKGVYTCKEAIEVKMLPHNRKTGREPYGLYASHTSALPCGPEDRRLENTEMN